MKDYIDKNGLKTIGEYINEQDELLSQQVATKQDALVSGTNIKTINGDSILGSGDLVIEGGDSAPEIVLVPTGQTPEGYPTGTLSNEDYNTLLELPASVKFKADAASDEYTLFSFGSYSRNADDDQISSVHYQNMSSDMFMEFTVAADTKNWVLSMTAYASAADFQDISNTVTGLVSMVLGKQDTLVSGTNIKTINNNSILGEGNLVIAPDPAEATELEIRRLFRTEYLIIPAVAHGSYSGDTSIWTKETASVNVAANTGYKLPNAITVEGADYTYTKATGLISLSNATSNVAISVTCESDAPVTNYIIGFSGAAQSNPALTRTDSAVGATVTDTNGVLEISGIDMSKVWGGYIGNDEEDLTWDATSGKFLHDGVEYTGNVFSKINRFFTKANYVTVGSEQVLDGYQLCYASEKPDNTWQDWFFGKPYTKIGCYKARGGNSWTNGLQSKQGLSGRSSTDANNIAIASNLNTSTTATMHMKWYNQNSILQVLFMALFATRQTEDVFPQTTYRSSSNTQSTGYLDEMRAASTCATGYSTSKTGNMFLGIEDFVGYGFECLGGVKLNGTNVQTSLDYDTFNYSNTYTQADINLSNIIGNYISSLQESTSVPGLLLPKKATGTETTYYCDRMWIGGVPIYQGAGISNAETGMFSLYGNYSAGLSDNSWAARLCGEPL